MTCFGGVVIQERDLMGNQKSTLVVSKAQPTAQQLRAMVFAQSRQACEIKCNQARDGQTWGRRRSPNALIHGLCDTKAATRQL